MMAANRAFLALCNLKSATSDGVANFPNDKGELVSKTFSYSEPATEEVLDSLSRSITLPSHVRQMLKISDGFEIFKFHDIDGYRIFSSSQLLTVNLLISSSYGDYWDDGYFIFGECIGDGTYFASREAGGRDEVLDVFLEVDPAEWTVIASDPSDLLDKIISSNGRKFWL